MVEEISPDQRGELAEIKHGLRPIKNKDGPSQ